MADRLWRVVLLIALAVFIAVVIRADDKAATPVIPVPEVDQLQWSNLRLQAANLRLQADAMDAKANEKLTELKSRYKCDECDFELTKEGKIQLVRRPEPKKEGK